MSPRGQQSGCQRNWNPLTCHLSPKWPDLCPILMCLLTQSWNTTKSMSVAPGSIKHTWVWNQMWYQILALPRTGHGTYPHSGHDLKKILSQGFVLRITWETKSAHSKTFHVVNKHPDPLLKPPPSVRWDGILWNLLSGNPCAFQAVGGRAAKATTSTRAGPVDSRHKLSNWGLQRSGNPDIPWAPLTSRLTAVSRKKLDSNQKPTQCLRCYMDRETSVERR